ncbi:alpha-ketoglutarate-dependent dioxygenase AlkB [Nostoc flagelliforme FACHB-838]|uniref:Alpha-ketoglutarate-dependent dioxygenase AlkB n=1 Tax=Nostoc flagelliforme FACHB-838 TaxID=2692904 RepID=A0ABR8DKN7_9NOSO|nr:alpha-ketoglutarate-dependent dioxygenase AlkB [Nostoc flagelliforme]MBD2530026.1 alpha-ketoglutarate-dependent dioxygenase AlkB [Nostoc flagelliforme FACHB-838]
MYKQLNLWENGETLEPATVQSQITPQNLILPDGDLVIYPNLFDTTESDQLFYELYNNTHWRQDAIKLYGKSIPLPRLTAWYGDRGTSYTYSGIEMNPEPWTSILLQIKSKIEPLSNVKFNSVLLNLYRDGKDGVSWHSDDEPELGNNTVIGSVSFGDTRRFMFRHKSKKYASQEVNLTHGSFLLMRGTTQQFWQHQIPKTSKPVKPRINLTFRVIITST